MNRLQFLKRLLTTTAAAVVAPKLLLSENKQPEIKKIELPPPPCYMVQKSLPTSAPFVISITNYTKNTIENVILGSAHKKYKTPEGISIAIAVGNYTYDYYLNETKINPFLCGRTYIQSSNHYQVHNLLVKLRREHGTNAFENENKEMLFLVDKHQSLKSMAILTNEFIVDGYEQFIISRVEASTTLNVYLYPIATYHNIK